MKLTNESLMDGIEHFLLNDGPSLDPEFSELVKELINRFVEVEYEAERLEQVREALEDDIQCLKAEAVTNYVDLKEAALLRFGIEDRNWDLIEQFADQVDVDFSPVLAHRCAA